MSSENRQVMDLLRQLNDSTQRLASCDQDPGADITAAAKACEEHHLALLQTAACQKTDRQAAPVTGPVSTSDTDDSVDLKEMIQSVVSQTESCIAVLRRRLEETARELAALRNSQRAVHAYRGRN